MPRNNQLQQERCQRHQGLSSDGEDREGTDAFNSPAAAFQHWSSQLRRRSPLLSTDKMFSTEENGDSDGENRDRSTKKTSMDESSGSNGIVAARKVDFSPRLHSHRSSTNKSASFPSKKDLNVFSVSRKDPAMTCSGPNHPKSSPISSKMTDNSPARRRRAVHGLRPPSTPHTPRSPQPSRPTSVLQSWTTHQPDPDFWPANESMDVLLATASVDSSGIHKAQSQDLPLHSAITQATCIHELWNATVRDIVTVDSAASQNDEGQTPIHLFAENAALADQLILYHNPTAAQTPPDADDMLHVTRSGLDSDAPQSDDPTTSLAAVERQLVHFGLHLLHAYPAAMMTPDGDGFIPFERTLSEWIDQVHREPTCNPRKPQRNQFQSATDLLPTQITSFLASSTTRWASQPKKSLDLSYKIRDETSSDGSLDVESGVTTKVLPKLATGSKTQEKTLHNRSRQFPDKVQLTAQAQFAFLMLSSFLDHLDRRLEETTFLKTRRSSLATSTRPLTGTPSALPDVGALGAEDSFHEAMDELRHMTVADIRSEIVRSIASIPDLVKTLLIMENDTQRSFCFSTALMHHVLASKYSVGPWLPGMLQHSEERISDLAVGYLKLVSERDIEDGIPRMQWGTSVRAFRNSGGKVERHGKMDLHDEVSRLEDFVPSLLSLGERQMEEAATTKLVRKVMDCIISRPFAVTVVFCDALFLAILLVGFRGAVNSLLLGGVSSTVTRHLYLANAGIFYFVVRELGKVVSLCMITRRARVYFQSFWNLADLLSTVLALTSTIAMRAALGPTETNMAGDTNLRNLLAITTGFLWLRVLNYLKGINMQLATFVLAILQITRDILWFCVILLTLIVSFAQMFFTLLAPDTCVVGDILSNKKECTQSEYYLKVYAILLGDFGTFERESFTSMFSVFLVVFYSFMVVLILLNILIAVASDSYEKCLIRSQSLFGRARVMMIAELVSFQNLLRKNPHVLLDSSSTGPTAPIYRTWLSGNSWANGWSRGSMTFFLLSSTVVLVWGIAETAGYATGNRNVNVWMSISSIAINVALFVGIVIFLSTGGTEIGPTQLEGYLQFVMLRLLGSTKDTTNTVTGSDHDGWQGRLVYIKTEIKRLSDEAKSETAASTKSLVNLIGTTEGRLQDELSRVEIGLNELKQLLQPGQLPSYQPNEKKTTIANIHNTMKDLVETLHRMETAEEVKGGQS